MVVGWDTGVVGRRRTCVGVALPHEQDLIDVRLVVVSLLLQ
jgi:hypothetical protein